MEIYVQKLYDSFQLFSATLCGQATILLANLHPKVYEIFEGLPEIDTYEKALAALEKYFGERYSKTFSVHIFRKLRQDAGQDIQQFVSILKSTSKECNFGAAEESEIKQQLISGVRDPKIFRELLLMDETATLENVITKAKQMEWSASEQGFMTGTSGSDTGHLVSNRVTKASASHKRVINETHNRNVNTAGRINDMLVKKIVLHSAKVAKTAERTTILQLCVNRRKNLLVLVKSVRWRSTLLV